ncbi:unnamed protein product [Chironomus riparius]|uniref:Uncharacterized protein n=1 Tax=Chironomus riparius TaxID=315576 RepID=A0A9N9S981_9DIPT|nr:unnamed protein product [Chironomus riparius]
MVQIYLKIFKVLLLFLFFTDLNISAQVIQYNFKEVVSTDYRCDCLLMSFKQSYQNSTILSTQHLHNRTDDDVTSFSFKDGSSFQDFPSMICDKFKNLKSIFMKRVVAALIGDKTFDKCTNLEELELYAIHENELDDKIFNKNLKFRNVKILSGSLNTISKNVFACLNQTLTVLNLHINSDSFRFPLNFTTNLTNLKTLQLFIENLVNLPQDFFENLENIENLQMISCNIRNLPKDIFKPLKNLQILNLMSNKLTAIHKDSFGSHPYLMIADFSDNNIISVDPKFYQFPSLLFVSLSESCHEGTLADDSLNGTRNRNANNNCTRNYRPR